MTTKTPNKLVLSVFIDAFGWEVYQRYGFLKDILVDSKQLKTTFGFSSAADPSILTGRYPEEHTHWSCFFYSPQTSPFKSFKILSVLPRKIFDRWRIRHWMSKLIARYYGFTGYFEIYSIPFKYLPLFDYLEKRDYFVPGGILRTDTIFDACQAKGIPYYCSNWRLSEEEILRDNKEVIRQGQVKFTYLYLPKLDAVMHAYGNEHPKVEEKIRWLEKQVRDVYQLAQQHYDEVYLCLFSDHGMANITGSVDVISAVEKSGLGFNKDYVAMYDSTMARFWFFNVTARETITAVLRKIPEGTIVSDDEMKQMKVYFPDHKFGELFFLTKPGILINPSFMGLKVIPGMHGFHPDDKDSYAFISANKKLPPETHAITDIRHIIESEIQA